MTKRRKLRRNEEEAVDAAVSAAFQAALPAVHQVEGIIRERLLPSVPADLGEHAVREFMNVLSLEV